MADRWTFSIEWTERIPHPGTVPPYRTVSYGEAKSYDTEAVALERRRWHMANMGSWTPETAVDAYVSGVGKRGDGDRTKTEEAA